MRERELELYEKYLDGNYIDEEDEPEVYELASIGLARIGFSKQNGEIKETAILTMPARNRYKREQILRNPISRLFYYLANV